MKVTVKEFEIQAINNGGNPAGPTRYFSTNPLSLEPALHYIITVKFEKIKTYTITTGVIGGGSVSVAVDGTVLTGPGPYTGIPEGANVELTATPGSGSYFVEWSGGITGSTNPYSFEIDDDYDVTAIFDEDESGNEPGQGIPTFTITTGVIGNGSVSVVVDGTALTGPGPYTGIPEGANVEITADPDEGSYFVEWSGDITGSTNPYSFEIDKDYDVTATFDEDEPGNEPEDESIYLDGLMIYGEAVNGYIEDQDDGAILDTAEGKFYDAGSIARLRAVANDGYTFAGWEFERVDEYLDVDTTDNTAEIGIRESLPGNLEVEPAWLGDGILVIAKFDPKPSEPTTPPAPTPVTTTTYYSLDVEVEGPGKVLPISGLYTENSMVVFTINPDEGARFVGWFGENGSEVAGNSIVMNGNKKLIAKFEAIPEEEPEEELPEEIVPAASPEEDVVEEQDVPYDAPILPQTGGIPLGLMISAGTGLMTAGFSLRKKKKDDAE